MGARGQSAGGSRSAAEQEVSQMRYGDLGAGGATREQTDRVMQGRAKEKLKKVEATITRANEKIIQLERELTETNLTRATKSESGYPTKSEDERIDSIKSEIKDWKKARTDAERKRKKLKAEV